MYIKVQTLLIPKNFLPQKAADFPGFFFPHEIFAKRDPFLRVFSTSEMADFTIFSQFLCNGTLLTLMT